MVPGCCQGLPVARTPRDNKGNEAFWLEIRCQFLVAEDWIPIPKGEMDLLRSGLGMWWRAEAPLSSRSGRSPGVLTPAPGYNLSLAGVQQWQNRTSGQHLQGLELSQVLGSPGCP